ncbi:MAG: biotin--[acetyl-CoA-carboxylase] ligase [Gammaproteobacteria bacterium]|nr:biotin--[acetyl-CoA-carboxylase] ligase [Gammaproteobacteria bacterium]
MFEKTDSTNEQALIKVRQGHSLPLACFADEQTHGRGRRGKVWVSPPGSSIYMSLAWLFNLPISELGALSLAMGVAVARVLKGAGIEQVGLKWPNDVLVDEKKIAGILIETAQLSTKTATTIIGIGLNFKLPRDIVEAPDQPWTDVVSLLDEAEGAIGRERLAGQLLQECMFVCENFAVEKHQLLIEYQRFDICAQQPVNVFLENNIMLQGVALGVETSGEIRILINGEERLFNSANISMRKTDHAND